MFLPASTTGSEDRAGSGPTRFDVRVVCSQQRLANANRAGGVSKNRRRKSQQLWHSWKRLPPLLRIRCLSERRRGARNEREGKGRTNGSLGVVTDQFPLPIRPFPDDDRVASSDVATIFGQLVQVLANGDLVRPAGRRETEKGWSEESARQRIWYRSF